MAVVSTSNLIFAIVWSEQNQFEETFSYFLILWPWKLTFSEHWMNFFSVFVSLMTYLSYIFY